MLIAFALAMLADTIEPPRDAGITVQSEQPLIALQACVTRKLAHRGEISPIPAEDGVDIDVTERTLIGFASEAKLSIHLRDADGLRQISVFYRHPYSTKYARGLMRDLADRCFSEEYAATPKL